MEPNTLWLLLLVAVCATSAATAAEVQIRLTEPLATLASCASANVLVLPSNSTDVVVRYSDNLKGALAIENVSDALSLSFNASITLQEVAKITVWLPTPENGELDFALWGAAGLVLGDGFSLSKLKVALGGANTFYAPALVAAEVEVNAAGASKVVIGGELDTVKVTAAGASQVWVGDVSGSVDVLVTGTSSSMIDPTSASVPITGKVDGVSSNSYTRGVCSVTAAGVSRPCEKLTAFDPPPPPEWSCGIKVTEPEKSCDLPSEWSSRKLLSRSRKLIGGLNLNIPGVDISTPSVTIPPVTIPGIGVEIPGVTIPGVDVSTPGVDITTPKVDISGSNVDVKGPSVNIGGGGGQSSDGPDVSLTCKSPAEDLIMSWD